MVSLFNEMLKGVFKAMSLSCNMDDFYTMYKNSGQISFFTAAPGVTRGDHYHHTKN